MSKKLWQLRRLSNESPLSDPKPLPNDWGPIFGLHNIKDKLNDLSRLGPSYKDMGWFETDKEEPEKPKEATPEELAWGKAKALLQESDWTMLLDAPIKTIKRKEYQRYRKQLRDIRQQSGFPHKVEWPLKPK